MIQRPTGPERKGARGPVIKIDYSNYVTTQTEWAQSLIVQARATGGQKGLLLGLTVGETLHRVVKRSRDPIEVM